VLGVDVVPPRPNSIAADGTHRVHPCRYVNVTVLRCTKLIGPRLDTVLTQYALPAVPTGLGNNGRMQLLHEQDALAVLGQATRQRCPVCSTSVATERCCDLRKLVARLLRRVRL
jgi:hypothetical protein